MGAQVIVFDFDSGKDPCEYESIEACCKALGVTRDKVIRCIISGSSLNHPGVFVDWARSSSKIDTAKIELSYTRRMSKKVSQRRASRQRRSNASS
ncbi:MAG: hypothetical protein IJS84_08245 [Spirochaetales bacterium]|nr:hypothetical protein [Spirochaetales bacterium]MBQ7644999.1 hypothetical protein [Spirochaetales bacterium]